MKIKNLFIKCSNLISKTFFKKEKNDLKAGQPAPDFAQADETGKIRTLQEYRGKKVVLFFYPKDKTPGCTAQACQLRDAYSVYEKNNIILLGINYDSIESHAEFKAKNNLPFHLLSDTTGKTAANYKANRFWLYNITPKRKTILIDEHGKIIMVMNKIHIESHSNEILKAFGY